MQTMIRLTACTSHQCSLSKPKKYIDNLDGIITELFTDTDSDNNDYLNKLVHPELNRLTVKMWRIVGDN